MTTVINMQMLMLMELHMHYCIQPDPTWRSRQPSRSPYLGTTKGPCCSQGIPITAD